ncbi:MAG: hypothetical protein U0T36_03115 [Saprospiraceae bacterium]
MANGTNMQMGRGQNLMVGTWWSSSPWTIDVENLLSHLGWGHLTRYIILAVYDHPNLANPIINIKFQTFYKVW